MSCGNCNTCPVSEVRGSGNSTVFNWLYSIENPSNDNYKILEVQFKADRKDFYINNKNLNIKKGDWVVVNSESLGHEIGKVTMKGELAAIQIKRKNRDVKTTPLQELLRKASTEDMENLKASISKEKEVLIEAKKIIKSYKLKMKLTDVEIQGDTKKGTFYYTAEKRVDFRQLIRDYSKLFDIKIEMKHIGVRQEAAKIGGIGSCGRELCCSTWMTAFPSVSTKAVRYQQLAINPQKISGQCGRLKCCLNFELDAYAEALKDFPSTRKQLKTKKGSAKFLKLDVFKGLMYYFDPSAPSEIIELKKESVKKIIELNKKEITPHNLKKFIDKPVLQEVEFGDVVGQDSIDRFDKTFRKKKKRKTHKK